MPLSVVAAFLRLRRKYEIDHLHAEALMRLSTDFPPTPQQFDNCIQGRWPKAVDFREESLFDVVNLAREGDARSIPPCALYMLCRFLHYHSTPFRVSGDTLTY
jgi:hypothetical protein